MAKLSDKQRVFINEYLQCWNATEAARRAGYKGSYNTLRSIGSENLTKPNIKAMIDDRMSKLVMSADETMMRLSAQAAGNMGDFLSFSEGVKLPVIDLEKAQDKTHLIKKLKYGSNGQVDIELHDQQAALVHIAKYHGVFTDKVEVSGKDGEPIKFIFGGANIEDDI